MGTKPKAGGKGSVGHTTWPTAQGPRVIKSLGLRWTDEAEQVFLDTLGATCNVTRAVEASGFSTATVYRRKRSDEGFAQRWQQALVQGFDRLELALLERATDTMEGRAADPEHPIPTMTVAEVIRILELHRKEVRGTGKSWPQRNRVRSVEEMRGSILAKLNAMETARRTRAAAPGSGGAGTNGDVEGA